MNNIYENQYENQYKNQYKNQKSYQKSKNDQSDQSEFRVDNCPQCGCIIEKGTYHYCEILDTNVTAIFNNFEYF